MYAKKMSHVNLGVQSEGNPSKILDVKDQHMLTELFSILTVGFSKYHYSAPLFYSAYYPITLKITTDSIKYFPKQVLFQLFKISLKTIQMQLSALKQKMFFRSASVDNRRMMSLQRGFSLSADGV